jgi:threonine 3-dehydrogenase
MRALVKAKREPGLWMQDVPVPELGPNDVLIKVRKTGICGTDLHIYNWDEWSQKTIKTPMQIGHEFMGEIAKLGSAVSGFEPGERVSGEGHITCSHCRNCRAGKRHLCNNTVGLGVNRPGCFAEYVALPAFNLFRVPKAISDEIASFFDPLGNAVHTALSYDQVGEDVLITGAGPIGLMAIPICQHVGARYVVVTDVNEARLELARQMGATLAVNPQKTSLAAVMEQLGMTEGFDVGLEMSGNGQAMRDMLHHMNHGGRVAILGIPPKEVSIDFNEIIFKGLIVKGIYGREMFETWYKMASLLQTGLDVSKVITHRFKAEAFVEGFEAMKSGRSGKVILDWTSVA